MPQAWKTFRSRDVSGISLGMYSLFTAGVALWLVYGLTLRNMPITVAHAIPLTLALAVLLMKLRYGQSAAAADPGQDETSRKRGD